MPSIPSFKLERYFAQYEFKAKYLLSPSDCESLTQSDVLAMADPETYSLWDKLVLGYTESPGHPLLRHEIAGQYKNISPNNIVVAAPEELIYVAMNTLLSPGDHIVCIAPAYQSLYEIAQANGCSVTEWSIEPDGDQWRLPLDRLEAAITPQTRLLIVNFPHNPTGYMPTAGEFKSIIDIARRHNLYVFCDEMYRLLEHNPVHRLPAMADAYERGISLSGLSKSFALPGLRIGWLATQDSALPAQWLAFKDYTTICNSAPSEILSIIALRATDEIVQRNLGIVHGNIEAAKAFIARHGETFEWFKPQGGSIAFPRWKRADSLDDFCKQIVEERGVMIVPGSIFDYPGPHFRIGLGRMKLPEILNVVDDFLGGSP
jgi:aspartate/methionine/tyrosine aminotransferase